MHTKSASRRFGEEINEIIVQDFKAYVWPALLKSILVMLPSIIFCAYSILNYDPMNIYSIENYFLFRCASIALLLFSFCIAVPTICFKKLQIILAGIVTFIALGGYYCYLPYKNYQNYSDISLIHKIQFNQVDYNKVIQEGNYFYDICQEGKCSMTTNYIQFYPTEGNNVKIKVNRNDSSFFSNEINSKDITITNNVMQIK